MTSLPSRALYSGCNDQPIPTLRSVAATIAAAIGCLMLGAIIGWQFTMAAAQ